MVQDLLRRSSINSNPLQADIDITTSATDFLWFVFAVMAFTTFAVGIYAAVAVPRGQRLFCHLTMMITGTASVAYFCMASDLGSVAIPVEFGYGSGGVSPLTRSIWYVRYVDWTITTPLLLLEILMVTGLPLSDIVVTIWADEVMIVAGLIGSLVHSQYKWGLYAIGNIAMFYVFYQLYFPGRVSSKSLGNEMAKTYIVGAGILSFLWFLYPIAWGLADGGNVISPTGEMIFYGILDLLAKPVFAFVHLFSLRKANYSTLHLQSGKYSDFENDASTPSQKQVNEGSHHHNKGAAATTSGVNTNVTDTNTRGPTGHSTHTQMVEQGGANPTAAPEVHNGHGGESTLGGH